MNKIISFESNEKVSAEEIREVAAKHPVFLQESVWEAYRAAENNAVKTK